MKTLFTLSLIFTIAILAACQSAPSGQTTIKQASVEQTKQGVEKPDAQFIDVRTADEYKGGHAPKAVNIPLDNLESELAKLDKNKPTYVICQSGRRSQKGAEVMEKAGFKEIYNVEGGTSAWTAAGFPAEK
jgi:rhodanese-related sulfurtransferase